MGLLVVVALGLVGLLTVLVGCSVRGVPGETAKERRRDAGPPWGAASPNRPVLRTARGARPLEIWVLGQPPRRPRTFRGKGEASLRSDPPPTSRWALHRPFLAPVGSTCGRGRPLRATDGSTRGAAVAPTAAAAAAERATAAIPLTELVALPP